MLIVGAKGFAKEVLEIFFQLNKLENVAFFDDQSENIGDLLFKKFPILKSEGEVLKHFEKNSSEFTIGIGNPVLRYKLFEKFINLGGLFSSSISPFAQIGHFDTIIGLGSNILANAIFSNSSSVGKGCLIYYNSVIAHDCEVGHFVEISPGATILGRCKIGSFSRIGSNSTILPDLTIGQNTTIGAGAVVTKNIPDNCLAVGVPARIIKNLNPLNISL